jgi:hypothetical protein
MQDIAGCEEYTENILPARNGIDLLKLIRELAQNLQSHVYRPNTVYLQMRAFYQLQQGPDESFDDFFERFDTQIGTLETVGSSFSLHPGIAQQLAEDAFQMDHGRRWRRTHLKPATAYLQSCDPLRCARLVEKLEQDYLLHQKPWPQTLQKAHEMVLHYKEDPEHIARLLRSGVNQNQHFGDRTDVGDVGSEPSTHSKAFCRRCKTRGHHTNNCRRPNSAESMRANNHLVLRTHRW